MNDSNMDGSGIDVSDTVDNDGGTDQDDGEGQGFIDCGSFFQVLKYNLAYM